MKRIILLAVVAMLSAFTLSAQTVEDVVSRAKGGDVEAQNELASSYFDGGEYGEAVKWWRKAAKLDSAEAQYRLSDCYLNGHGVIADDTQTIKWCRAAAEQGYVEAQNSMGGYYHVGYGVEVDEAVAVEWWRKAAQQGHVEALYNLAFCNYMGCGTDKNIVEAAELWRRAAEL